VAFGGAVWVGTVILKPITESGTYVGVPARKIV
jgi:serine acetyltransferase